MLFLFQILYKYICFEILDRKESKIKSKNKSKSWPLKQSGQGTIIFSISYLPVADSKGKNKWPYNVLITKNISDVSFVFCQWPELNVLPYTLPSGRSRA